MATPTVNTFRICVGREDMEAFLEACTQSGWFVQDTGERITTDHGIDAEVELAVTVPAKRVPGRRVPVPML